MDIFGSNTKINWKISSLVILSSMDINMEKREKEKSWGMLVNISL